MLVSGTSEYESKVKEFNMLEFSEVEAFNEIPSPRVLNTHMALRYVHFSSLLTCLARATRLIAMLSVELTLALCGNIQP